LRWCAPPIVGNLAALLRVRSRAWVFVVSGVAIRAKVLDIVHVHLIKHCWILPILRLVVSVNLHGGHLGLKLLLLLALFLLLLLLLLLLFFLLLGLAELIKHVLVVEDGVGKLIFEVLVVQQDLSSSLDNVHLQDLIDRRPLGWVLAEHDSQKIRDVFAVVTWHVCVLSGDDFLSKHVQRLCIEGWLQGTHFVQKDTQRPNIRLEGIGLRLDDFR